MSNSVIRKKTKKKKIGEIYFFNDTKVITKILVTGKTVKSDRRNDRNSLILVLKIPDIMRKIGGRLLIYL